MLICYCLKIFFELTVELLTARFYILLLLRLLRVNKICLNISTAYYKSIIVRAGEDSIEVEKMKLLLENL